MLLTREFRFTLLAAAVVSFAASAVNAAAPPGRPYSLTIEGTMKIVPPAELKQPAVDLETFAKIDYVIDKQGEKADFSLRSEAMTAKQNGKLLQESFMSRDRFRASPSPGAPANEIAFDKAPAQLQQILLSFDTPILSITLDPSGKETDRKILAQGPLAKLHADMVDTILSMHAPFPEKEAVWKVPAKLAMGQGNAASGVLTFERVGKTSTAGTPVNVKVSGDLTAAGTIGQAKVQNGRYAIQGEQVYDPVKKAWDSARWTILLSMDLTDLQGKSIGTSKGKLDMLMGAPDSAKSSGGATPAQPAAPKADAAAPKSDKD